MKIAFTGHRPNKLGNDYDLKSTLINKIYDNIVGILIMNSPSTTATIIIKDNIKGTSKMKIDDIICIVGMALGIDTLAAKICIEYEIPFIAAIPFAGQEFAWPMKSQKLYHSILANLLCDKRIISAGGYTADKMQKRNIWMVDQLDPIEDKLIGVWDGSLGGTKNCIDYAKSKGFSEEKDNLIIINPKTI